MTENNQPGSKQTTGDIASEFQNLGTNLKTILQQAWESEERKNLQREIETGLGNLGRTLDDTAREFRDSETGQRLKSEAEELQERIRSGEAETRVREDLLKILHKVNNELEKFLKPGSSTGGGEEQKR
jgi:hypothetical protein